MHPRARNAQRLERAFNGNRGRGQKRAWRDEEPDSDDNRAPPKPPLWEGVNKQRLATTVATTTTSASGAPDDDLAAKRAQRFATVQDKTLADRAARFHTDDEPASSSVVDPSVIAQRLARFGNSDPTAPTSFSVSEEALAKRAARFGDDSATATTTAVPSEIAKKRQARFVTQEDKALSELLAKRTSRFGA